MNEAGPNPAAAHHAYCFAGFLLDLEREALLRDGEEIRLRPKSFEMLRCLAAHAETLVTKDQLLGTVWPDTVVTESSLSQCLADIRRALGDDDKILVRTVPRRGVILDAAVTERLPAAAALAADMVARIDASSDRATNLHGSPGTETAGDTIPRGSVTASPGAEWMADTGPAGALPAAHPAPARRDAAGARRRYLLPLAVLAIGMGLWWVLTDRAGDSADTPSAQASTVLPMSIAVLPFADLSEDADQAWFGDGVAEEIIHLLVRADDLQVMARTSSFSFKDRPGATIRTIAEALKVAYVLEGSVRRDGDRLRVTAQLIDTADSTHLWSRAYDRPVSDLFETQLSIAGAVADGLRVRLLPSDADTAWARSVDSRSYERSLEGRYFYHRRGPGDLDRARACLEDAVALDPDNAAAWMYLAGVFQIQVYDGDLPLQQGAVKMKQAVDRALALAPDDAEVQLRAGQHARMQGDTDRAWRHLQKARELDADNWLVLGALAGNALANLDFETALRLQRRSAQLDPLSPLVRGNLVGFLLAAGRFEEAESEAIAVADLSPPRTREMLRLRAESLLLRGRAADALAVLDDGAPQPERKSVDHEARWISARAMALHALGRPAEARTEMTRLGDRPAALADLGEARFHGFTGNTDLAFAALDRLVAARAEALERGKRLGINFTPVRASPFLKSLRDDPRWTRFMAATRNF